MGLKIESRSAEYPLTALAVDKIAEEVETFLSSLGMERANILRIRLSIEEALLVWMDRFGDAGQVRFFTGSRWRRPTIILSLPGERYDPMSDPVDELGIWSESLLTEAGLTPRYIYRQGLNILQLRLKAHRLNPTWKLLLAVLLGLGVGIIGSEVLPESAQTVLIRTTLDPIQSLFFRIMNAASGPVIFLTVVVAICGVGKVAAGGKQRVRMLLRFILITTVLTVLSLLFSFRAFSIHYYNGVMSNNRFFGVLELFLNIVPNDVVSPFVSGDSPQIILLAVILGNILLVVGDQAESVMNLLDQCNSLCLVVSDWVSRLAPFFITILLILGMWDRSMYSVLGCWKPFLLFLLLTVLVIFGYLLWVSRSKGVPISLLWRKLWPSFRVALRTASVDEAFGESSLCCENKLGISSEIVSYSLPLGLVVYMPAASMASMVFSMYAAKVYGIVATPVWAVTAVLMTVTLLVATPPLPGVGLLTYAAIFARLGIPTDGLTIALMADVIFGFVTAASNQIMLQLDLILQADRMGGLDTAILKK